MSNPPLHSTKQLLIDVVGQLGREDRIRFREFVQDLKAKRDAGEIPSLSQALMNGSEAVVGTEVWRRALEKQEAHAARRARDAAFVRRADVLTVVSSYLWRAVFSFTDVKGYCGVACTCKIWSALARDVSTRLFTNALAKVSPAAMMQLAACPAPATAKTYIDLYQRFERLNVGNLPAAPARITTRQASDFLFTVEVIDSRRREVLHACTATVNAETEDEPGVPADNGYVTIETERLEDAVFERVINQVNHLSLRLLCFDKITRRTCALASDARFCRTTVVDGNLMPGAPDHEDAISFGVHEPIGAGTDDGNLGMQVETNSTLHLAKRRFCFWLELWSGEQLQLNDFLTLLEHHAFYF